MASSSQEILHDYSPFLRVHRDGRIERLMGTSIVPASVDLNTGVQSKDIEISPDRKISARLYLPKNTSSGHRRKLPLLVYFHGGGFVIESAFSPLYHNHLNSLVAEANVVAVSVNYRLAPEYPLPIAYEDSWVALKWVASHSKGEGPQTWLKDHADFNRVYLGGDSAGGNIAHNIAIRAGLERLDGVNNIAGVFLNCPYLLGKDPIGDESGKMLNLKPSPHTLWPFVYPDSCGLDDPFLNPAMNPKLSSLGCKKVLVYVAEKDLLKDRGWYYKEALHKSSWVGDVEVVEVEGENHVFNLLKPTSDKAVSMLKKLAYFLNNGES